MLTDVVMPKMNGRELVERLRALRATCESCTLRATRKDGIEGPGATLLEKPIDTKTLLAAVRDILDPRGWAILTAAAPRGRSLVQKIPIRSPAPGAKRHMWTEWQRGSRTVLPASP